LLYRGIEQTSNKILNLSKFGIDSARNWWYRIEAFSIKS
jgi:hypothetical protein